jgi:glycosyltransferase involved in cell wall biosynthesis
MACGCVVVGYDGFGGREYFDHRFSYPVLVGDITGYADTVKKLVKLCSENPDVIKEKGHMASEYVREKYSPQKEQEDILSVWNNLLC